MQLGVVRIEKVYLRLTVTALAVLAMLIFAPPANAADPTFSGASTTRSVPENTMAMMNVGAAVTATDSDNDTLTYALASTGDGSSFTIDSSGQLLTSDALDYETKSSYTVTVDVHDGNDGVGNANTAIDASITVTITVTNEDEPGTVSISGTVSGGSTLTASVTDIDGTPTSVTWQWSRGDTAGGSFTRINPATSDSYTPVAFDVGKYLRARANYTDPQGSGKTARAETSGAVVSSNAEPMFSASTTTRSVPENSASGIDIGAAVTATDIDSGDTLFYWLTGSDAGSFTIDSASGQIKAKSGVTYDFESAKTAYTVTVNVRDSKDSAGNANTVTDDSITVTITVTNADEPGTASISGTLSGGSTLTASVTDIDGTPTSVTWQWARGDTAGGSFTNITSATSTSYILVAADVTKYLRATANYTDPQGSSKSANATTGQIGAGNAEPTFSTSTTTRTLLENTGAGTDIGTAVMATDSNSGDTLFYSLNGSDAGSFTIDSSSGQIKTKSGVTYNYEATKKSYTVTVNVRDSKDVAGDANTVTDDSITVTINLTNAEEPGMVSISGTLSGGSTLMASLTDPDGSISIPSYQWKRSGSAGGTFNDITSNGTSSTYVLVAADVNQYLKVTVSYTDGQSSGKSATSAARGSVGAGNAEPMFSTDTAMLTVPENSASGTDIGAAVTATDSDSGDTLFYSLTGSDAGSFTIDSSSGQIKIKSGVTYNFESAKTAYTVTVNVRDSKDSAGNANTTTDDTIAVTINLTNADEPGTVTISGTLSGGETLTASVTDIDGTPTSVTWRWARGDTAGGLFDNIIPGQPPTATHWWPPTWGSTCAPRRPTPTRRVRERPPTL